jgi:O-antigen/teichoic acid export membrane protein
VLVLGGALAQLLTLLITPLITRYYAAPDFGEWAVFLSIAAVIIAGSAFRYDLSILLPSSKREVLGLSIISSRNIVVTTAVCIVFLVGFNFVRPGVLNSSFILLPVSILIGGINLVLSANLGYQKQFKSIAIANLLQTITTLSLSVSFCFISFGFSPGTELIISSVFGQLANLIVQSISLKLDYRKVQLSLRRRFSVRLAKKYYDFAAYSLPACYISSILTVLPVYTVGLLFNNELVGQYALANRILITPLAIIGSGFSQVLFKHFSEKVNSGVNVLSDLYKIWGISLSICVLPGLVLYFYGQNIVVLVFGEGWVTAGQLVGVLIIPLLVNFSLNIASVSHAVLRLQKLAFYYSVGMLAGKLIVTYLFRDNYLGLLLSYVLVESIAIFLMNATVVLKLRE